MKLSTTQPASEQFFQYLLCSNLENAGINYIPELVTSINFSNPKQVENLNKFGITVNYKNGQYHVSRNGITYKFKKTTTVKPDITIGTNIIEMKSLVSTLISGPKNECDVHYQVLKYVLGSIAKKGNLPSSVVLAYITNHKTHFNSLNKDGVKEKLKNLTGFSKDTSLGRVRKLMANELNEVCTFYEGLKLVVIGSYICATDSDQITLDTLVQNIFYKEKT